MSSIPSSVLAGAAAVMVAALAIVERPQTPAADARPGEGRQPEWPLPSIRDYKPKSGLVVPQHPRPRAKFPVIDIHSHYERMPITSEEFDRIVAAMDQRNLQVLVNLSGSWGEQLERGLQSLRSSRHSDRMVLFANVDFSSGVGPGFGERAAAQLEKDIRAGALGLKIFKDLGMSVRRVGGGREPLDDPELDPMWATCARLGVPVLIHTGEPQAFFEPIDFSNERWLELALFRSRRHQTGVRFEELIAERNRVFERHGATTFIAAHMAYHANDLARLGQLLDDHPNVFTEVAAVLAELGRQPRAARAFFVKYQDRVLFGKDSFQPDEYPYYWRTFETADEYFDYYRDYHAFWKLYGLDLPDEVLKKLYYRNALSLVKGLPRSPAFDVDPPVVTRPRARPRDAECVQRPGRGQPS